jgi:hypothetical protein
MDIKLQNLLKIDPLEEYKIHFAVWNGVEQPLDVFTRDRDEWKSWNSWRGNRDDFSRKFIFSLIRFYHQTDKWLFGGIFEVKARSTKAYTVQLDLQYIEYIGRLLIHYPGPGVRGRAFNLEKHYSDLIVSQLFDEPYSGEAFCGRENIAHAFSLLEPIFKRNKEDWKAALEDVKGVYLIVDKKNGKMYVGSAYGDAGIWSRWSCYMDTGHGGDEELMKLIKNNDIQYARDNFQFSILDCYPMKTDDQVIKDREQYWKKVLLSNSFGYNKN